MKSTILDRLMAEWIVCGGLVMRRATAYRWLRADAPPRRAGERSAVDYFAFRPDALALPADAPTRPVTVRLATGEPYALDVYDGPMEAHP
jgi:hypothetical protein